MCLSAAQLSAGSTSHLSSTWSFLLELVWDRKVAFGSDPHEFCLLLCMPGKRWAEGAQLPCMVAHLLQVSLTLGLN